MLSRISEMISFVLGFKEFKAAASPLRALSITLLGMLLPPYSSRATLLKSAAKPSARIIPASVPFETLTKRESIVSSVPKRELKEAPKLGSLFK